jgi:hypothetical protein
MAYRKILVTMLVVTLAMITWIVESAIRSFQTPFVRKVSGLPFLFTHWDVYDYGGKLFALYSPDDVSLIFYRIDPITERVIETIEVKQPIYPQAVIARHYRLPDAWLAEMGFWAWEIDPQRKIAYAVKPPSQPTKATLEEVGYLGIYLLDIEKREVKGYIEHRPFAFFALHPSGHKLYVESLPNSVRVLDTTKLEWIKEFEVTGDYWALFFSGFSKDGKYLFAARTGELIVINTEEDKVEEWGRKINEELDTKYDAGVRTALAFSEDKSEIYAALAIGSYIDIPDTPVDLFNEPGKKAHGGVAAIDLAQKKIVRILGLTQKGECNSVAVIGNKLFVASWEGVFVIDIDRWRQQ